MGRQNPADVQNGPSFSPQIKSLLRRVPGCDTNVNISLAAASAKALEI